MEFDKFHVAFRDVRKRIFHAVQKSTTIFLKLLQKTEKFSFLLINDGKKRFLEVPERWFRSVPLLSDNVEGARRSKCIFECLWQPALAVWHCYDTRAQVQPGGADQEGPSHWTWRAPRGRQKLSLGFLVRQKSDEASLWCRNRSRWGGLNGAKKMTDKCRKKQHLSEFNEKRKFYLCFSGLRLCR